MRIVNVLAQGFMSFRELDFDFPETGLTFVGGEVVGSSLSSSNGAGKSALFEALCWGLYGKTLRGSAAAEVVNWATGKNCSVLVVFMDDRDNLFTVARYRNHKQKGSTLELWRGDDDLTGSDMRATQVAIEAHLGMSWAVFSTAVVFGEKAQRFTEARDAEKKAIFDEILLLHRFQEAQKALREELKRLREERIKITAEAEATNANIATALDDVTETEKAIQEMEEAKAASQQKIEQVEKELARAIKAFKAEEERLEVLKLEQEGLQVSDRELMATVSEAESNKALRLLDANRPLQNKRIEHAKINGELERLRSTMRSTSKLKNDANCPTCGQLVTKQAVEKVNRHYKREEDRLKEEYKVIEAEIIQITRAEAATRAKIEKEVAEVVKLKNEVDAALRKVSNQQATAQMAVRTAEGRVNLLEREKESLTTRFNERELLLTEQLERAVKRVEQLEAAYATKKAALEQSADEERYLSFWEDGFGNQGIKSFLLDEILPSLNERVEYYASALMGDDIGIKFDTESTLKSGEARDKFDVGIWRDGTKVEYAICSGGEKRRIDVCILMALQSLVFERSAANCNLVVLDEVFDSLDRVGIEKVVNLLSEEAQSKAIFVISHLSEFRDYFENEIIIRKSDGVSEVIR